MKPKLNLKTPARDLCQTPGYALEPIVPFLKPWWHVWEPACGEGLLVEALSNHVEMVSGSDILYGRKDFLSEDDIFGGFDAIVTNPPYSLKYKFIERCYKYGMPWALLLPVETLAAKKAQTLFDKYGMELVLMDARVDFKMPNTGYNGKGAQFPVAWFTWKFEIGQTITYMTHLEKPKRAKSTVTS